MAWSPEHKQQSRERILKAASRLFAARGFEQTGIDQVMAAADMTRGAFYSHFKSKAELYTEAMTWAGIRRFRYALGADSADQPTVDSAPPSLNRLVETYLSEEHISGQHGGCPMAFLVTDIAQRDEPVRSCYTRLLKGMLGKMSEVAQVDRPQVLQNMVMMIGGVAIARAVNDPELQQELLNACKTGIQDNL